jgi:hypothetical protein
MIRLPAGQSEKRPSILNPESDSCLAISSNQLWAQNSPLFTGQGLFLWSQAVGACR